MADDASRPSSSTQEILTKGEAYRELKKSQPYVFAKLLADAWCAAFVIPKVHMPDLQPRVTLTESALQKLENNPNVVPREVKDEIVRLADRYRFFHWHLGLPNVFQHKTSIEIDEDSTSGRRGGFDVVLGNPPWDQLQLDLVDPIV